MMHRSFVFATGALAALTLMAAAPAASQSPGVVFEITTTDQTSSSPSVEVNTLEIQGANLAMAVGGPDGVGRVIFLGDRNELIIEDHTNGTYTRIDQPTLDRLAGQVNAAMAQLEEAMAGMPEAQREMMRQMQARSGLSIPGLGGAEVPAIEVVSSGRSETRAGYRAAEWQVVVDGDVERRLWVTPWSEVDGAAEAKDAFTGMAKFFDAFLDAMPSLPGVVGIDNPFSRLDEVDGLPVVTEELAADGTVERTSEVTAVERRSIDPATFQPTPGLTERPLPSMGN